MRNCMADSFLAHGTREGVCMQSRQEARAPEIPPSRRASRVRGSGADGAPSGGRQRSGRRRGHRQRQAQHDAGAVRARMQLELRRRAAGPASACWRRRGRSARARPPSPRPLSSISISSMSPCRRSRTSTRVAPACLSTLVSASCATRSSCSAACGDRVTASSSGRSMTQLGPHAGREQLRLPAEHEVAERGAQVVLVRRPARRAPAACRRCRCAAPTAIWPLVHVAALHPRQRGEELRAQAVVQVAHDQLALLGGGVLALQRGQARVVGGQRALAVGHARFQRAVQVLQRAAACCTKRAVSSAPIASSSVLEP